MTSQAFLSFGTYVQELDLSQRLEFISTVQGGIVGATTKGPLALKMITSPEKYVTLYGEADPAISFVGDAAKAYLGEANQLWVKRVVNQARYSALTYWRDVSVTPNVYKLTSYNASPIDMTVRPYTLSADFVSLNSINVAVTNGVDSFSQVVTFDTDSNTTLAAVIAAVRTLVANFTPSATVVPITATTGNNRQFQIISPVDVTYTFTFTTTLGASQPTVTLGVPTSRVVNVNNSGAKNMGVEDAAYLQRRFSAWKFGGLVPNFVASNKIDISITDGDSTVSSTVIYATSHNSTVAKLSEVINTLLASFTATATGLGANGVAGYVTNANNANVQYLYLYHPVGRPVVVTLSVSSGATQPTITALSDPRIMEVWAENPGIWGSDLGIAVRKVDVGLPTRWKLVASGPFVTGNQISVIVEDSTGAQSTVGPVAFATDSDTTMGLVLSAMTAAYSWMSGTVTVITGGVDNDREIIINGEATADSFKIVGATVTGGSVQPTLTSTKINTGSIRDNSFDLNLYLKSSPSKIQETYRVSINKQVDGFGRQQFAETVVNDSATASDNIRVWVNPTLVNTPFIWYGTTVNGITNVDDTAKWLTGGNNGLAVTSAQIITGWDAFKNRQRVPARLYINAGYTDPSVQKKMVALAESRGDAFSILDMPSDQQKAQAAYDHRQLNLDIDSSYAAIYTPDLSIRDTNDYVRYVPPSGDVGGVYAYTTKTAKFFSAPAGLNRGRLLRVIGLRENYDAGDTDLLHPVGINTILDRVSSGPVVFGEETLQVKKSALSSVHVRLLQNVLKTAFIDGLDWTLWEPHTENTRFKVRQLGQSILDPVKNDGGITEYYVLCDKRNNPPEVINRDVLCITVYYKPVRAVKYIKLVMALTQEGADFEELIANKIGF